MMKSSLADKIGKQTSPEITNFNFVIWPKQKFLRHFCVFPGFFPVRLRDLFNKIHSVFWKPDWSIQKEKGSRVNFEKISRKDFQHLIFLMKLVSNVRDMYVVKQILLLLGPLNYGYTSYILANSSDIRNMFFVIIA